jgi:hypothetical protein
MSPFVTEVALYRLLIRPHRIFAAYTSFDTSDDVNINDDLPCHTDVNIEDDQNNNIFDELKDVRGKHPHSFQCAYLNINSFRNKYCSIKELLNENLVDMICIAESKLDDTFRNSEFNVENYHLWRAQFVKYYVVVLIVLNIDICMTREIIVNVYII